MDGGLLRGQGGVKPFNDRVKKKESQIRKTDQCVRSFRKRFILYIKIYDQECLGFDSRATKGVRYTEM